MCFQPSDSIGDINFDINEKCDYWILLPAIQIYIKKQGK